MIGNIKRYYTSGHKILKYVETGSGFGGPTASWENHLHITGRLRALSGKEALSADKQSFYASHKFYCDIYNITREHRYQDPSGNVYHIKFVKEPMGMGNHLEIDLELISHEEHVDEGGGD